MQGKLTVLKNASGETVFPVTSSEAVISSDGATTLEQKINTVGDKTVILNQEVENAKSLMAQKINFTVDSTSNVEIPQIDEKLNSINNKYETVASQLEYIQDKTEKYQNLFFTIAYSKSEKIEVNGKMIPKCSYQFSNDGYTFKNIDTPQELIGQDFSIYFYKDTFYLLTFTKNSGDFGLYTSKDLVNFTKKDISANISTTLAPHVWFGQWFEDKKTGKLYIVYSAQVKEKPMVTYNLKEYVNLRVGIVEVKDVENLVFGEPRILAISDNNRFDGFIEEKDGIYYLATRRYIDDNDNSHEGFIEIWSSTDLLNWELRINRVQALNDSGYECMSIAKKDNMYYMYVYKNLDYSFSTMYRVQSLDLINWSNKVEIPPTSLVTSEMGTVHYVTNQDQLRIINNLININTNKGDVIRPTNFLKLESTRSLVWRNLNYSTETLKVISAEDVIYNVNVNVTDVVISNIISDNDLPHRFFIRSHTGDQYYTIKNTGNIYLPDGMVDIKISKDIIAEFVYDNSLNKYVMISPCIDYLRKVNGRKIILNDLASDNIINNLELENNCMYVVNLNTTLTINNFTFKNNFSGEFNVYFLVNGEGSKHYTSLTLNNNTPSVLLAKYDENSFVKLTSADYGNKLVNFKRTFGKGQIQLVK